MDKKKGLVIQAKFIEPYKPEPDKVFYVFGVRIKIKEDGKFIVDSGLYYSPTKDQTYFTEGHDVEYTIDKNKKEPRKSKIKPYKEPKKSSGGSYDKMTIEEYTERKIADTPAFTASYVSKLMTGHTSEDIIKNFEKIADKIYSWQISKLKE